MLYARVLNADSLMSERDYLGEATMYGLTGRRNRVTVCAQRRRLCYLAVLMSAWLAAYTGVVKVEAGNGRERGCAMNEASAINSVIGLECYTTPARSASVLCNHRSESRSNCISRHKSLAVQR